MKILQKYMKGGKSQIRKYKNGGTQKETPEGTTSPFPSPEQDTQKKQQKTSNTPKKTTSDTPKKTTSDTPKKKKSWDEAYASRNMKTYGNLSKEDYIKEAKRQKSSHAKTGKWDYKNAPKEGRRYVKSDTATDDTEKVSVEPKVDMSDVKVTPEMEKRRGERRTEETKKGPKQEVEAPPTPKSDKVSLETKAEDKTGTQMSIPDVAKSKEAAEQKEQQKEEKPNWFGRTKQNLKNFKDKHTNPSMSYHDWTDPDPMGGGTGYSRYADSGVGFDTWNTLNKLDKKKDRTPAEDRKLAFLKEMKQSGGPGKKSYEAYQKYQEQEKQLRLDAHKNKQEGWSEQSNQEKEERKKDSEKIKQKTTTPMIGKMKKGGMTMMDKGAVMFDDGGELKLEKPEKEDKPEKKEGDKKEKKETLVKMPGEKKTIGESNMTLGGDFGVSAAKKQVAEKKKSSEKSNQTSEKKSQGHDDDVEIVNSGHVLQEGEEPAPGGDGSLVNLDSTRGVKKTDNKKDDVNEGDLITEDDTDNEEEMILKPSDRSQYRQNMTPEQIARKEEKERNKAEEKRQKDEERMSNMSDRDRRKYSRSQARQERKMERQQMRRNRKEQRQYRRTMRRKSREDRRAARGNYYTQGRRISPRRWWKNFKMNVFGKASKHGEGRAKSYDEFATSNTNPAYFRGEGGDAVTRRNRKGRIRSGKGEWGQRGEVDRYMGGGQIKTKPNAATGDKMAAIAGYKSGGMTTPGRKYARGGISIINKEGRTHGASSSQMKQAKDAWRGASKGQRKEAMGYYKQYKSTGQIPAGAMQRYEEYQGGSDTGAGTQGHSKFKRKDMSDTQYANSRQVSGQHDARRGITRTKDAEGRLVRTNKQGNVIGGTAEQRRARNRKGKKGMTVRKYALGGNPEVRQLKNQRFADKENQRIQQHSEKKDLRKEQKAQRIEGKAEFRADKQRAKQTGALDTSSVGSGGSSMASENVGLFRKGGKVRERQTRTRKKLLTRQQQLEKKRKLNYSPQSQRGKEKRMKPVYIRKR